MEHRLLTWHERGQLWLRLGIRGVLTAAAVLLVIYVGLPLVSLLSPFVLALILAWGLNPLVRWLQRKLSISRKVISMVLVILVFAVLGGALFALGRAAVGQVISLFNNWQSVADDLLGTVDSVGGWLAQAASFLPQGVLSTGEDLTQSLTQALTGWLQGLNVSGWLAGLAGRAPDMVSTVSSFAVSTVVFVMASYFITGDYPRLRFLLTDRMPDDARDFFGSVRDIFVSAFGGYIKSQLLLSLGVFLILTVGFVVMGQPYGLLLAALLAVLDFIPIVGAGTIMVPWAVVDVIRGSFAEAAELMVIWGIIVLFRRVAEPKILGDQTGLSPILSLVGIYAGMKVGGVLGMVLGPLLILVFLNLVKLGIFHPLAEDLRLAVGDVRSILKRPE
jgi:sporulation integral membrane protein YtvI